MANPLFFQHAVKRAAIGDAGQAVGERLEFKPAIRIVQGLPRAVLHRAQHPHQQVHAHHQADQTGDLHEPHGGRTQLDGKRDPGLAGHGQQDDRRDADAGPDRRPAGVAEKQRQDRDRGKPHRGRRAAPPVNSASAV